MKRIINKLNRNFYKHTLLLLGVLFSFIYSAQAQEFGDGLGNHIADTTLNMNNKPIINALGIVIGSTTFINSQSIALQIESADKAILISRVFGTGAILAPVNGMLVYSTFDDKFYAY